jgi:hypothetical protein
VEPAQVLLNPFERHACEFDVLVGVCFLDVVHEQVDQGHHGLELFGFGVPAGLHDRMQAVFLCGLQQSHGELELKRGLPTG